MQIRHLSVSNFRGVQKLDWNVSNPIVCFIGPGDSTKTTILDAIEYTLSPRWSLPFDDGDFYQGNIENTIEIVVTISEFPEELLSEDKFGLYSRGWNVQTGIHDEPEDGDEQVLSIRLRVDDSLEPEWTVINDRDNDGRKISSKDRARLGVSRLGESVDKHLAWGRGSILSQLTDDEGDAYSIITKANRQARIVAKFDEIDEFNEIARQTKEAAALFGVKPKYDFTPALDPKAMFAGMGAVSIHDGRFPFRLSGLGSRRLTILGLQISCLKEGAILLIDEVEHGLEPHRIRHLLRMLKNTVSEENISAGQVFMTTHSDTVAVELPAAHLFIVRSHAGNTSINQVSNELQSTIRKTPEAMLARKILVCEGKTEYGFCRTLEGYWKENGAMPFAYIGAVPIFGGGDEAPKQAQNLASLGFNTCLFIDSDKLGEIRPDVDTLKKSGVKLIHWDGKVSIEQRLSLDITWNCLKTLVLLAIEIKTERIKDDDASLSDEECERRSTESIFDTICNKLETNRTQIGIDLDIWEKEGFSEDQIRNAIGLAAKQACWFKRIDYGERLGAIVIKDLGNVPHTNLAQKINELEQWIYE